MILATAGVGAAHALVPPGNAQEPPPTVTTPTVPAPTVPAPSTPTATVPTPPPVRLAPVVTSPSTRLAPAPPAPPAEITVTVDDTPVPARQANPQRWRGYVAPTPPPQRRSEPTPVARPRQSVPKPKAFEATLHRTSRRVSVRLALRTPKAGRAFLVVRGPAPSCRVAGHIPVRGARTVFAGRVQGRRLGPGIYRISPSPNRRFVAGAPTAYVHVVSSRRSVPVADSAPKPACRNVAPAATPVVRKATARPPARVAGVVASEKPSAENRDEAAVALPVAGGVLGEATEEAETEPFLAIATLALVAGLLLVMVALVTKFLRGSWNP